MRWAERAFSFGKHNRLLVLVNGKTFDFLFIFLFCERFFEICICGGECVFVHVYARLAIVMERGRANETKNHQDSRLYISF